MLEVNEDYTRVLDPLRSIDRGVIIRTDTTRAVVTSVRGALGPPALPPHGSALDGRRWVVRR